MQVLPVAVALWRVLRLSGTAADLAAGQRAAHVAGLTWLGFGVRSWRSALISTWSVDRRRTFLLRADVDRVLSVDPRVWPPIDEAPSPGSSSLDLHLARDLMLGYAPTEARFESAVKQAHRALALVGFSTDVPPGDLFACFGLPPAAPPSSDTEPRLLGYDIATGSFLSGLSNCGYESGALADWGRRLSSDHLLKSASEADPFRQLTEKRVPEHAPFYAIGVWLLRES